VVARRTVRDDYNNPVSGVDLGASITSSAGSGNGKSVSPTSVTTGGDGRTRFTYTATNNVGSTQTATIEVTFDGGTASETAVFEADVLNSDGSGGGGPP